MLQVVFAWLNKENKIIFSGFMTTNGGFLLNLSVDNHHLV